MTLKQLHYIAVITEKGSITEAAKALFIAQPSLKTAVRDLENELGITIFARSKKGITLTTEGEEFLSYARQVLEQTGLIEQKYKGAARGKQRFAVSAQHYSFVIEAFVDTLQTCGGDSYEFHMRETKTYDIIEDVAHLRSEIGVLYLNGFNEAVLRRTLSEYGLGFHHLFTAQPHVFIGSNSPLAGKDVLTLDDLAPYPRLSYEQGERGSFYFSEEILSTLPRDRDIVVCDRATLFNLLIGMNGYTICSGVISEALNGKNIVAKPLAADDYMEIGYILPQAVRPGKVTQCFIAALEKYTGGAPQPHSW